MIRFNPRRKKKEIRKEDTRVSVHLKFILITPASFLIVRKQLPSGAQRDKT